MVRNRAKALAPFGILVAASFACVTAASAADQDKTATEMAKGTYSSFVDMTAGGLIGQPVVTKDGAELGKVSDLVIGKLDRVSYAVVSVDSTAERVVIPYQSLKVGSRVTTLAVNMTPRDVATLPKYDSDDFSPIRVRGKG